MIALKFFGKGAAFFPKYGNTNAFFILNNTLYLLDCGESTFERLNNKLNLESFDAIYVLLTHMHADHCGSLATLISYSKIVLHKKVHVVYPNTAIQEHLRLVGISPDFYHYLPLLPESKDLKVQPLEVQHANDMACFGYLLSDDTHSIYYSGDAAHLREDMREAFLKGEIARIYHDTASHKSESHFHYKEACKQIPEEHRERYFCMHLDAPIEEELQNLGFSVVDTI